MKQLSPMESSYVSGGEYWIILGRVVKGLFVEPPVLLLSTKG